MQVLERVTLSQGQRVTIQGYLDEYIVIIKTDGEPVMILSFDTFDQAVEYLKAENSVNI